MKLASNALAIADRQREFNPPPCPLPCCSAARARERVNWNLPLALMLFMVLGKYSQGQDAGPPAHEAPAMLCHPGWSANVVASDPVIADPVALRMDRHHRLWVVEMPDYPTGPKPGQAPAGRIRILKDQDGDGVFESATTFADHLLFPTGVQPWRDGAIVTLAGKIVWMQDRNEDGVAEVVEDWFEGFAMENEQLRANHPVLAPDGLVYVAGGLRGGKIRAVNDRFAARERVVDLREHDFCFDPDGGTWDAVAGNSQFGMSIDDYGRRFGCSNRNPVLTTVLDAMAVSRDPLTVPRDAIMDVAKPGEASLVRPRSDAWTTSNLHAGQFSAACGVMAPGWFDGSRDSEMLEWLLVCEPTGNLIQRQALTRPDGAWQSTRVPRVEEFASSTNIAFRPVDVMPGPEHTVLVCDMVRAVIEHPHWAPEELKNRPDTWEGQGRGRVWKLVSSSAIAEDPTGTPEISWLGNSNPWIREVAGQYFFEQDTEVVAGFMRGVITDPHSMAAAVARAASWLAANGLLDAENAVRLLEHDSLRVVELGIAKVPTAILSGQQLKRLVNHEDAAIRLAIAARLSGLSPPRSEYIDALASIAQENSESMIGRRVLGSIHSDYLPELCRRSANEPRIATSLLQHWWSRWAFESTLQSLQMLVSEGNHLGAAREVALLEAWMRGNQRKGEQRFDVPAIEKGIGNERLEELRATAEHIAVDAAYPVAIRSSAIRVASGLGNAPDVFGSLISGEHPIEIRASALAACFQKDPITTCQRLNESLLTLPPSLLAQAVDLISADAESTLWLLGKIASGELRKSLIPPSIAQRCMSSPNASIATRAREIWKLSSDRAALIARYRGASRFGDGLKQADVSRGKSLFEKNCAACHRIDGVGVNVGPDISDNRNKTPAAILTAILDPNAAIDAAYFQYSALKTDGKIVSGLLMDDRVDGVTLRLQGGTTEFIPRDEVERLHASGVSLMPDGFEGVLDEEQMADLVAYLKYWRYSSAPAN